MSGGPNLVTPIESTKVGRACAMALLKHGEIVVMGDTWDDFCVEAGVDSVQAANALHALRFRGYATFDLVHLPKPRGYQSLTRRYTPTGRVLPDEPRAVPALIDADEASESMRERRALLKPSTAMALGTEAA